MAGLEQKVNDFVQLVEKMSKGAASYGTFKPLLTRFGNYVGAQKGLTLVKQKGPLSFRCLPICNDRAGQRLLLWSARMEKTIDLAKLAPKPIVPPTCYEAMFKASELKAYVRPEVKRFCVGNFDEDDIAVIADILCVKGFIDAVQETIVDETIARNYPEALLESGS